MFVHQSLCVFLVIELQMLLGRTLFDLNYEQSSIVVVSSPCAFAWVTVLN